MLILSTPFFNFCTFFFHSLTFLHTYVTSFLESSWLRWLFSCQICDLFSLLYSFNSFASNWKSILRIVVSCAIILFSLCLSLLHSIKRQNLHVHSILCFSIHIFNKVALWLETILLMVKLYSTHKYALEKINVIFLCVYKSKRRQKKPHRHTNNAHAQISWYMIYVN